MKQIVKIFFKLFFLSILLVRSNLIVQNMKKPGSSELLLIAVKIYLEVFFEKKTIPLDDLFEKPQFLSNDHREVIEAVLSLSQKYRDVIYLHYYEGYTASEISQILGKNVNTIYTLLTRSKKMLRDQLGGEYNE